MPADEKASTPAQYGARVSVVIPTHNRPYLLRRAIDSVLRQTMPDLELIVVVDGPDEPTQESLSTVHDPRLTVVVLPKNLGHSGAVNAGVERATAPWVALLDDDDEWMPEKLDHQLRKAQRSNARFPLITCYFVTRTGLGDMVWPRRRPAQGEPLCEYLFSQRWLRGGDGMVLPSAMLVARELIAYEPWPVGLVTHNDSEWLLGVADRHEVYPEFVDTAEPLAIWNVDETRPRLTTSIGWRFSVDWILRNKRLVTPLACASFLLSIASTIGARANAWEAFWKLPLLALRHGRPRVLDFAIHLLIWLSPKRLRIGVNALMDRNRLRVETGQSDR